MQRITDAMVDAAYRVLIVETEMPYLAKVRDYTNEDGTVDREALRAADLECERKNKALVRRALKAALAAAPPRREPTRYRKPDT